jgi:methyl coenzyme M reductase gamma subunit
MRQNRHLNAHSASAAEKQFLINPAFVHRKAIVHELLHLKYPNNGKMFHALERIYLGKEHGVTS